MPELVSEWKTNGLATAQLATFVNILTGQSAALQATQAAGGTVDMGADFRTYTMPIITAIPLPTKVAENANKPVVESTPATMSLTVDMWAQFHQMSRQLEATRAADSIVSGVLNAATGQFPIAYDIEVLGPMVAGAGNVDVEYDAANPIASISAMLAPYDGTVHGPDAVVLTRAGARKLGFALDGQNRLQTAGGAAALFGDIPVFITKATAAQLGGAASLMGVVGPFGAGHWASAESVSVERMPQATVNAKGPEQNIVNYRIESAFGYGNAIDRAATRTGVGFTTLIDAI